MARAGHGRSRQWHAPAIGALAGLGYGLLDRLLVLESVGAPRLLLRFTELVEFSFPVILGVLVGLTIDRMHHQPRINQVLSTENAQLQRNLLAQTLSSYILHEIRNPLHNLTSLLDELEPRLQPEERSILHDSLVRLDSVTHQLSRWNVLDETIDPREAVLLPRWLDEFVNEKVRPQLHRRHIAVTLDIEPVIVRMHPLLLEQCLILLINNAIEAIARAGETSGTLQLAARLSSDRPESVEIHIRNSGERYPSTILSVQGSEPSKSQHGMGLGLVLVRRVLEQIGGSLSLRNEHNMAMTVLWIPGARG